nr:peritrophin-48-like [Procambarus clarkii]
MIKRSLLIIVLAVVSAALMVQKDACDPDCTGKTVGDLVPDPMNCTTYYICLGDGIPTDHSVPCPDGQYFNPGKPGCDDMPPDGCQAACQPPDCSITCKGSFTFIRDPFDCGTYYICIAGQPAQTLHCNTGTFFNGETCVSDKEVCCTVSCDPYCHPGIVQTPDPTDCTKYYICTQTGPVNPSFHYTCDSEQYFDYKIGRCASGTSCKNLCSEGLSTTPPNSAEATRTPQTTPPSTD